MHGLVIRRDEISCICRAVMFGPGKGHRVKYDPIQVGRVDYGEAVVEFNKAENHWAPFGATDKIGGVLCSP